MFPHYLLLTTITLCITSTLASPDLQPWKITRLVISGLPYRENTARDPLNTLAVEILDPNSYSISSYTDTNNPTSSSAAISPDGSETTTQCILKFPYLEPPYGIFFNCTSIPAIPYGTWSAAFFPTRNSNGNNDDTTWWNPGQNFTLHLRFLLASRGTWYDALADFSVGANMRGMCSAGGICSFSLKEEMVPYYVDQTGPLM